MKIVFFGTPEFAVESLDALVKKGYDIAAVVTMPDKPAGRRHLLTQSDVKKYAVAAGLPVLQPKNLKDPAFLEELKALNADLFIVIAFRMLPEAVWSMPPLGTFNLHGSLLPRYRGAAPINRAVMNGETRTGVTTFFLRHEIDTGDVIDQREIEIGPDENVGSVYDRLMHLGAEMVVKTVADIENGTVTSRPQPEGEFIPAPKIFREDCLIDWHRTAAALHNQVRGLSPYPAAFSMLKEKNGKRFNVKVFRTALTGREVEEARPGECRAEGRRLFVATADSWLEILELQPQGKKPMAAEAFLLGYAPECFIDQPE